MTGRSFRERIPSRSDLLYIGAIAMVVLVSVDVAKGWIPGGDESTANGPSIQKLARAAVYISAVGEDGEEVWSGSGSIVSSDGLILTAAHVVDNRLNEYSYMEVAITANSKIAPSPTYRAAVAAIDYALDLAVIRIETDLDGNEVTPDLPYVAVGDSNETELLTSVRILGYPGTGGRTLTATAGEVSGFGYADGIEGRAFVKTDATVFGGSSGGMVVNDAGELIAVPIEFGAGPDDAPLVDCRFEVDDTNGDGLFDEADSCIALGGFINSLRPVNLAIPLIAAAQRDEPYVSDLPESNAGDPGPPETFVFEALVLSPETGAAAAESTVARVCGSWRFSGMSDGLRWDAVWYLDGFRMEDPSLVRRRWIGGATGTGGPLCFEDPAGLPDGLYELSLSVDGVFQTGEAIFVGGGHPVVEFTVTNDSQWEICDIRISPTLMSGWGPNDLQAGDTIPVRGQHAFDIPAGLYDIGVWDCDDLEIDILYDIEAAAGGSASISGE